MDPPCFTRGKLKEKERERKRKRREKQLLKQQQKTQTKGKNKVQQDDEEEEREVQQMKDKAKDRALPSEKIVVTPEMEMEMELMLNENEIKAMDEESLMNALSERRSTEMDINEAIDASQQQTQPGQESQVSQVQVAHQPDTQSGVATSPSSPSSEGRPTIPWKSNLSLNKTFMVCVCVCALRVQGTT